LALLWLCWRLGGASFAALGLVLAAGLLVLLVGWRRGARPLAMGGLVTAALALALPPRVEMTPVEGAEESLVAATDFSDPALAEARASGKPVFLWFTADWCLTCKVNENVAIARETTRAAFEQAGVVAMRGDWTRRDPAITRFLTEHGAAGVPLYLWYAPGSEGEVLPQVLTPGTLTQLAERS